MPKASDFFLTVVDFFAILVPGAVLAYLVSDLNWIGGALPALDSGGRWVAFAVAAFLLGQVLYALGSWLLDPLYGITYVPYKEGKKKHESKELLRTRVGAMMGDHAEVTDTYPWARAYVGTRDPASAASIARIDADSKFFRALTVVLGVAAVRFAAHGQLIAAFIVIVAAGASFLRFSQQRWERDDTAYETALTLPGAAYR